MTAGRKKFVVLSMTVLLVTAGGAINVIFWPRETEPLVNLPKTAEEGFRVAASEDFARLPDYRQEAYRREVQRQVAALTEEQRQAMFLKYKGSREFVKGIREIQYDPVKLAMQQYYQAAPEKRTAVLDNLIDQMERFRALGGLGRSTGQSGNNSMGTSPELRDYMKQRIENQIQEGNPKETAKTMEFMKQFRQRRIDRGLPVP